MQQLEKLPASGLLLVDSNEHVVYARNVEQLFVPASTVKLLTALIALQTLGDAYHFRTEFYLDPASQRLWVKGLGDPYLVSEELDLIALKLKDLGVKNISSIGVDASYFVEKIDVAGRRGSNNPYDAPVSALAVNFNTIKIIVSNQVTSGEAQTPITPIARELSKGLARGTHRINLGLTQRGPAYFAEVLASKLNAIDISVETEVVHSLVPEHAQLIYTHKNSRSLKSIVAAMLEYSNNFIASQLYLNLGAHEFGAPATTEKARKFFAAYIQEYFTWENYALFDGAGLSKRNQLNAKQLVDVLSQFKHYRDLMPRQSQQIYAKTGTLNNVSTYAGYVRRAGEWSAFALLINQSVPYDLRERIASQLISLH